jgi:hypothetical protein
VKIVTAGDGGSITIGGHMRRNSHGKTTQNHTMMTIKVITAEASLVRRSWAKAAPAHVC